VIEDHFPLGRPPYEKANVQMVDDVAPYELMKLRLLNASHQGLCFFSHLIGYKYVHEAMEDPLIVELLQRYMDEEATPTLLPVPGVDLVEYKAQLIERFSNRYILDTTARLAAESSDRIPKFILPVVHELLKANLSVRLSAAIIASWARYAEALRRRLKSVASLLRSRMQDLCLFFRNTLIDRQLLKVVLQNFFLILQF
jgi:mannitol 2-dehydrogenase